MAVLGLFSFLCGREKKTQNPHEIESCYTPEDGCNGASVQSEFPPSVQQFSTSDVSLSALAAKPSMSNTATKSSFLSSSWGMVLRSGTIVFTYDELKIATNDFSSVNLLGQGRFGYVHKGTIRNSELALAVKSLKADSEQAEREFRAELEVLSRVHHKHLVTLVGYCITDSQRFLVYEFVQNNTLEFHLHEKGEPVMDWPTRLKIAVGVATGMAYLHEDCNPSIIHRDIKPANILLDHTFEAQVANFGLAKLSSDGISTRFKGTYGYIAPEYASSGVLTKKCDVFSIGVLLLELITGRRAVDFTSHAQMECSVVDWARPLLVKALQDGDLDPLVDPRLKNNYNPSEMGSMITCAASCVRRSAKRRPRMGQIVRALEGNFQLSDLSDSVRAQFSSLYSSVAVYETPKTEDMLRFRTTE